MDLLPVVVIGVIAIVLITTISPKFGIAAPLILVVLGAAVGLLPFIPAIHIEPEWILGGVLPPLLYSAAVNTPTMGFRRDLWTISVFAVLLVIASAVSVGFLLTWLVPDLPLSIGIAVGAVVSPTDAVATGIVRRSGVSTRIINVLDGEALFNDATALVLLRSAIAAVAASVSLWNVATDFLYSLAIAILIGVVVGRLNVSLRSRIPDTASNVAFSLTVPFLAAIPAEHIGASGLVAAVVAGLITGQRRPKRLSSEVRIAESAVWETISHILESGIFLVMGLQLYTLIVDMRATSDQQLTAIEIVARRSSCC
ncbi:MAG: sodium:proton antiporter [Thermomicrobiales bacterium]|nr:sodium:proton antiporter [Thermomicrobiales bacterium]